MDNFALIRHQAQMADNHTADLEIKRLAQAVISLSRLCEEAQGRELDLRAIAKDTKEDSRLAAALALLPSRRRLVPPVV